jgi:Rrf2 family transcriptional regulator, cysteine metabolism repressor
MFQLTSKTTYGLLAILEIAMNYGSRLVQIKDIVKRYAFPIPRNYLEQILNILTKNGMIRGIRGSTGGYELTRDPRSITLFEVIEALEGTVQNNPLFKNTSIQPVLNALKEKIIKSLQVTLADLVSHQKEIKRQIDFEI